MSRQIRFAVWLLILNLAAAAALHAQLNRGVVEGIVSDPSGAVVPGVKVSLKSVNTNVSTSVTTNSAGYYRVANLVPGNYTAHLESAGFAPLDVTQIEVLAGETRRVDAQLRLGTTALEVQVTAEMPLVETAAANFSTTLGTGTIQDVPLAGRDLQQLVNLLPGVN